jgi:hypothetical protein
MSTLPKAATSSASDTLKSLYADKQQGDEEEEEEEEEQEAEQEDGDTNEDWDDDLSATTVKGSNVASSVKTASYRH